MSNVTLLEQSQGHRTHSINPGLNAIIPLRVFSTGCLVDRMLAWIDRVSDLNFTKPAGTAEKAEGCRR
jgi:hypothetical protein